MLLQHVEHRLITIAEGVEAITQAQRFARIVQHAGIRQPATLEHFQQTIGHDAVQPDQLRIVGAAAQQFQSFYRAVIGQEEIIAVVAPVHLGGMLHHVFDFVARQVQRHRGQAAQFGLGVFVDHLSQRQDKQARRVFTHQAVPARQLYITDEGAVGQHQMLIQIQPAIRPAWTARCADYQAQHAVAPAADPVLIGLGQQIVNGVDPFRINVA
ncbi:hypothetical protein D3C86_1480620 [compost metagenome]